MGNLPALFDSRSTAAYVHPTRERKDRHQHDDCGSTFIQTIITIDSLKILAIVVLLTSSIILSNYGALPLPATLSADLHAQQTSTQQVVITEKEKIEENSYGFHPFYQVHKRIRFQNPKTVSPCHNINPSKTLLLAILSRASNVHIREAIRQSWGAIRTYNGIEVRVTFVVGVDDGMLKQIELEQEIYHDVIQVNLPENYPVVSYKELATICWSRYFCPDIQYIFKADEDIHLNTPLLTSLIAGYMQNETHSQIPLIIGWFRHKSRVDRSGRYTVTEEEYPEYYYPPYTFGIGYLLTRAGRDNLCVNAQRPHPVTRVGDAYITGILRKHAEVGYASFRDVHFIYSYTLNGPLCQEYFTYDPKLLICMSSVHSGTVDVADEYIHVWNAVLQDDSDDLDDQE